MVDQERATLVRVVIRAIDNWTYPCTLKAALASLDGLPDTWTKTFVMSTITDRLNVLTTTK